MKKLLLLFGLTFGFTCFAAAQEEATDSIAAPKQEAPEAIQVEERVEQETVKEDIIYDLSGRRVDENYRGFVIKNGKKYLQQ